MNQLTEVTQAGDVWWPFVPGAEVGSHRNKVTGAETGGRLFQMIMDYPRGAAPPLHIHHDADETFFVLDGAVSIFVGEERLECSAGDFALVPKGVAHTFLVNSARAEVLVTFATAGIEGFFEEVAPPVIPGAPPPAPAMPDPEKFTRLMRKYDCEPVGPPPALEQNGAER